jgi:hypothetical protein
MSCYVRTPRALEVSRQGGRDAVREMLALIVIGVRAGARARPMKEYELWHAKSSRLAAGYSKTTTLRFTSPWSKAS